MYYFSVYAPGDYQLMFASFPAAASFIEGLRAAPTLRQLTVWRDMAVGFMKIKDRVNAGALAAGVRARDIPPTFTC